MSDLITIEIGLLGGTIIFFTGLYLKDWYERRERQKLIDKCGPYRFINSPLFAKMMYGANNEQAKYLLERYKDR